MKTVVRECCVGCGVEMHRYESDASRIVYNGACADCLRGSKRAMVFNRAIAAYEAEMDH